MIATMPSEHSAKNSATRQAMPAMLRLIADSSDASWSWGWWVGGVGCRRRVRRRRWLRWRGGGRPRVHWRPEGSSRRNDEARRWGTLAADARWVWDRPGHREPVGIARVSEPDVVTDVHAGPPSGIGHQLAHREVLGRIRQRPA